MSEWAFTGERRAPWQAERGLGAVLSAWQADPGIAQNLVLDETLPPVAASYAALPATLSPLLTTTLERRGITRLYAHQAHAYELAASGRDVVIATPTASGKSLCYNLPVLDHLARDPSARALYLFPTKALSRDQESALRALLADASLDRGAITYDGDTPGDARRAARERAALLLTNPDMLHAGILPHHAGWARLFANLRFVVVDELHSYRGVFGSHLANVLRRLRRVARFHGAEPVFLFASATIGNPREHATRILGRDVELVGESGAPAGPRRVMIYNPPVVNAALGVRESYVKAATKLAADLVRAQVPTIVFGQSRNNVEVMLKYLRDRLAPDRVDPAAIHAYRGGYLPETRRRVEVGLRTGEVRCVVATNALELGIDIGQLDAVICAGYPGSIAALWQRFGRAGRRGEGSLALMVASSMPLDQYVAREPRFVLGAPVEHARIDPDNVEILVQHLKCAAFELPFAEGEAFGDVPPEAVSDALGFLAQNQVLHAGPGAEGRTVYHWAADAYPATHVSLRTIGWDNFVIVDLRDDRTIAEMDWRSAHTMLHEQAIYQHEGEQYQVEKLDYDDHKAFVRKVEPDYFTTAQTYTKVSVLGEDDGGVALAAGAGLGEVNVVEKVVGYKKIKFHTHENVGYGDVHLPEMQMQTTAFWLVCPEERLGQVRAPRADAIDALRGIGHALHLVAAFGLMIDPRDLGETLQTAADHGPGFDPTIFLYDHFPGGIGLAPRLFQERETLLRRARELVDGCTCSDGCPACIGPDVTPPECRAPNSSSRKQLAQDLLGLLGAGATH